MAAKRLGQWATRLYIILLIIGLSIPSLYTIIRSQTLTKTYVKPSFKLYEKLQRDHENALECPCSSIATTYNEFVKIDARFHEICLSPFASNQWYINVTAGLVSNLSIYDQRDYRRFFSAHLQFLQGLCNISIESVSNTIDQFLSSLLITTQLLSKKDFDARVSSQIELSRSNAPTTLGHFLFLIRNINHGNAIISKYGTNFQYIIDCELQYSTHLFTKAIIYDDECSCGLSPLCATQASFIESNSSKKVPIQGLKMGCTPSESFRASTLECFYNQSCLDLIQQYTNYKARIDPIIPSNKSRFSINTTMAELIDHLFIEKWNTTINYTTYFEKCLPLSCSYTYIQRFNIFYIITLLLSFQGGLTIVLKWICPKLVYGLAKIYNYRKRQTNIIQPSCSHGLSTINITTTNVYNADIDPKPIPTNRTLRSQSICQLKFQPILINITHECYLPGRPLVADFNGDNQLDLAFSCPTLGYTIVLLGNLNGSFKTEKTFSTEIYRQPAHIAVGDFNNDNRSDIAVIYSIGKKVYILLANDNEMFKVKTIISIEGYDTLTDIFVADFNGDKYLDIAVVDSMPASILVFVGYGNGSFSKPTMLPVVPSSAPECFAIVDFNDDGQLDIAVKNKNSMTISIYFRRGDGTFEVPKWFYTGPLFSDYRILADDFNGDTRIDLLCYNSQKNLIGLMAGFGNGTFELPKWSNINDISASSNISHNNFNVNTRYEVILNNIWKKKLKMNFYEQETVYFVSDYNCDDHADIISYDRNNVIFGLLGHENSNFEQQPILSPIGYEMITDIVVGDFDSDTYQDIIVTYYRSSIIKILLNRCECCKRNRL
ncbi:unnamed protein product [Adineta steineri]|uniref:Uncharacterized protein n=1 Tax=Adineta steineri TaxID=433720 RepID=A0A819I3W5_9BILA|nr:unnamed protein product [Adineta steineri]